LCRLEDDDEKVQGGAVPFSVVSQVYGKVLGALVSFSAVSQVGFESRGVVGGGTASCGDYGWFCFAGICPCLVSNAIFASVKAFVWVH
jgi:hypothetical protein